MTKTNTKTVKVEYDGVVFHDLNENVFSFWFVENGVYMHAVYPSSFVRNAVFSFEDNQHLSISIAEGCEPIINSCEAIESVPARGCYFVMKPYDQPDVTFYGVLGEDFDVDSNIIKDNIFFFRVDNGEVGHLYFNDDLIIEDDDVFRAPTEEEQIFIANVLKDKGYIFNEDTCKIEKLN